MGGSEGFILGADIRPGLPQSVDQIRVGVIEVLDVGKARIPVVCRILMIDRTPFVHILKKSVGLLLMHRINIAH